MPPVITAIVEVTFWVAKAYSTAIALGGAGAFAVRLGTVALLSSLSSKLFGPKVQGVGLSPMDVMSRSSLEHRKIVYGQAIVSGPVYYNNLSGTNNEYLWYGVALCDGEIEDFVAVHFDSDVITKAQIAWTAGPSGADGSGTGDVSLSTYIGENSTKAVQIYYTLGHDDQVVLSKLDTAFGDWTTNHRLRGVAHVVVRLLYNADTEKVWKSGPPNNIKAVIKGRKIYDPRLDSTQIINLVTAADSYFTLEDDSGVVLLETGDKLLSAGTSHTYGLGAHRTATASTWTWADNPALCISDYLMNVIGVPADSINWPSVADAADDCEVSVAIPTASTEGRFTCNGALSLGSSHKDNLDSILSSMVGKLSYSGGVWKLRAGVWETSSVTITEDDLVGDIDVRGSAPKSERFNSVRGFFVDPTRNYEASEFPHVSEATYVTRDNGETITYDLQLPMTNSATEAQRIAYRNLAQGNNQIVAKLKLNAKGSKIAVGDVVSVTLDQLSWSAKTFRCIEWVRNPDSSFNITLKEDDSTDYDDPSEGAYGTGGTGGVTIPTTIVPPPVGLSVAAVPYGVKLTWTNPAVSEFDFIDIYASSTSAWSGAAKAASVRTETYTHNLGIGTVRYYWLQARRNSGDVSLRIPDSDTSTIVGTSGGTTDSVSLAGATLSDELVTANDAEVSYRLASTGEEQSYEGDGGTHTDISTWLLSGAAGDYDARLTVNSGTNPTGSALATWLDMGSTLTWTLTDAVASGGVISNNCTVEIRDGSTSPVGDVLASATVTMSVEKQAPTVALSGSSITPNSASDFEEFPTTAVGGWRFNTDGTLDRLNKATYTQFAASTEWIIPNSPAATYYIRATNNAGNDPDAGPALSTWHALSSEREWSWTRTTAGSEINSIKVEIADGASPQVVLATGYYGCGIEVGVPE